MLAPFSDWIARTSLPLIGLGILVAMIAAASCGYALRNHYARAYVTQDAEQRSGAQEGYMVSAVLGLLALLLAFTYSLAIERFESRRQLVLEESNAIGTAYLRVQLLGEPHRTRLSGLLIRYTDNRIELANALPGQTAALLKTNDAILTDLWAAQVAAYDTIAHLPVSVPSISAMNTVIDMDSARKAARLARVPGEVFALLFIYITVTAGVLGYVLTGSSGRISAGFLLMLLTLSLLLVIDIDRPTLGGVRESQGPMEQALASMKAQPPGTFDRYRQPATP